MTKITTCPAGQSITEWTKYLNDGAEIIERVIVIDNEEGGSVVALVGTGEALDYIEGKLYSETLDDARARLTIAQANIAEAELAERKSSQDPDAMSFDEVSHYLNVSKDTIETWIEQGCQVVFAEPKLSLPEVVKWLQSRNAAPKPV